MIDPTDFLWEGQSLPIAPARQQVLPYRWRNKIYDGWSYVIVWRRKTGRLNYCRRVSLMLSINQLHRRDLQGAPKK